VRRERPGTRRSPRPESGASLSTRRHLLRGRHTLRSRPPRASLLRGRCVRTGPGGCGAHAGPGLSTAKRPGRCAGIAGAGIGPACWEQGVPSLRGPHQPGAVTVDGSPVASLGVGAAPAGTDPEQPWRGGAGHHQAGGGRLRSGSVRRGRRVGGRGPGDRRRVAVLRGRPPGSSRRLHLPRGARRGGGVPAAAAWEADPGSGRRRDVRCQGARRWPRRTLGERRATHVVGRSHRTRNPVL